MQADFQRDIDTDEVTLKRPAVVIAPPEFTIEQKNSAPLTETIHRKTPPETMQGNTGRRGGWQIRSVSIALLVFIVLNIIVQFNNYSLAEPNDGRLTYYRLRKCEALGKLDALYLGSSHIFDGVEPSVVDSSVQQHYHTSITSCNLGLLGSTIEEDYYVLKRYIEDGYTPKLVVEDLWERNFNVNSAGGLAYFHDPSTIVRLADLSDLPDVMWHYRDTPNGYLGASDFALQKIIPIYGLRNGIMAAICGKFRDAICAIPPEVADWIDYDYKTTDKQGWADDIPPQDHMTAYDPQKLPPVLHDGFHSDVQNFVIGGPEPAYLDKLIQLAQSHHIKVSLTSSPAETTFFHYFDNPSVWPMVLNYYQGIANTYNVPFYNDSTIPGLTYLDYFDPQHLNDAGARIYSTWYGQHVIGPLLTGQPAPAS